MARLLTPEFAFAALTIPVPTVKIHLTMICCSMPDFAVRWENLAITSRTGIGKRVFVIPGTMCHSLAGGVASASGLRDALLDTNPATAFNPFLGIFGRNTKAAISQGLCYPARNGHFELPLGYFTLNGDAFNLPAGPVSFALGLEYRGERWRDNPDSLNTTFNTVGGGQLRGLKCKPGCLGHLPGSADSGDQPDVELPRRVQP